MYTYDDFLREADKAGVTKRFSPEELATAQKNPEFGISMVGLLRDQQQASTAEQRLLATEAANQMRKNYGLQNAPTTYQVAGAQDNYAGLLDQANAQGSFAYDPEKDPVWSAYKKQYAREGERASANAMAQAAAMSGGIPSSYAITAGQQAGNYYAGQMSDIIPTLEQTAYQRYLADQQTKQQEFENALMLYQTLGYATPEVEKILGISGGKGESNTPSETGPAGPNPDTYPNPDTDPNTTEKDLLDQMLDELQGDEEPDGTDYKVANDHNDYWVSIGGSKLTWPELLWAVNQGEVLEIVDPKNGTRTYKFAEKNTENPEDKHKKGGGGAGGAANRKPEMVTMP